MSYKQRSIDSQVFLTPLFPNSEEPLDINNLPFYTSPDIGIVIDNELKTDVLEMQEKDSQILFNITSKYKNLVLQFKHVGRFFKIDVEAYDINGRIRKISLQNNRSTVYVIDDDCAIPLVVPSMTWQILKVDVDDIMTRSFGAGFKLFKSVVIEGALKVSKVYCEDQDYCDAQLPKYLRLVGNNSSGK